MFRIVAENLSGVYLRRISGMDADVQDTEQTTY